MTRRRKPVTTLRVSWDHDSWLWDAECEGRVVAFGSTDRDPDPSVRPDEDRVRRDAAAMGADVEWDTEVEWVAPRLLGAPGLE